MKVSFYRSDSNDLVSITLVIDDSHEKISNEMIASALYQIVDAILPDSPVEIIAQDANEME